MFENNENQNFMNHTLKKLDDCDSEIFVYNDVRKINKSVTIIKGLKDKDLSKNILRELKKNIGTDGYFKNGLIILQGNNKDYVNKYLDMNIMNNFKHKYIL